MLNKTCDKIMELDPFTNYDQDFEEIHLDFVETAHEIFEGEVSADVFEKRASEIQNRIIGHGQVLHEACDILAQKIKHYVSDQANQSIGLANPLATQPNETPLSALPAVNEVITPEASPEASDQSTAETSISTSSEAKQDAASGAEQLSVFETLISRHLGATVFEARNSLRTINKNKVSTLTSFNEDNTTETPFADKAQQPIVKNEVTETPAVEKVEQPMTLGNGKYEEPEEKKLDNLPTYENVVDHLNLRPLLDDKAVESWSWNDRMQLQAYFCGIHKEYPYPRYTTRGQSSSSG
jgi:hypothetical protein